MPSPRLTGCHQLDSAFQMFSGCQRKEKKRKGCQSHIISSMKTECHNVAGRIIIKLFAKALGEQ
eukprot:825926-Pelagomonas_calceolata.AAC.1